MAVVFHRLLTVEQAIKKVEDAMGGIRPLGSERVALSDALGRVLASNVDAKVDSPAFDRSEVDGYAVQAKSTYGAEDERPVRLKVVGTSSVGALPEAIVRFGEAVEIATGAPLPRGANSVVMVEYTKRVNGDVLVYHSVVPGENVAQTGSDMMVGDTVLRAGTLLGAKELAVLGAIGYKDVEVYKRPRIAVLSVGDELVPLATRLLPGKVYDVNGLAISQMIKELGAEASYLGIVPDDYERLKASIREALGEFDMVITSGSTSAGLGDMIYRVFDELGRPGVLVHGLKIKPGKPTVVALLDEKLAVGLPGFPVSAMISFTVFVQPILLKMMGLRSRHRLGVERAKLAIRVQTGKGRREFIPVNFVASPKGLLVYPLLRGSGATSSLALADGFIEVPEEREFLEEGEEVGVKLFSNKQLIADVTIIGSHCPALDLIIDLLNGVEVKTINVGSTGGWLAIKRGEADIAGTHLFDPDTLEYNVPFLKRYELEGKAVLIRGYGRRLGFLVKKGNPKAIRTFKDFKREDVIMINRNTGSGTRVFIDHHLKREGIKPEEVRGYDHEAKTHSAVASAVAQGRADVGIAVEAYAQPYDLDFIALGDEVYDFLVPKARLEKKAVKEFLGILSSQKFAELLPKRLKGYHILPATGKVIAE